MKETPTQLSLVKRVEVRFSEVDSIRAVWHGNYVKYLEDAREEWGRKYGLGYMTIFENGYYAPVYQLSMQYLQMATVNDVLLVNIVYCKTIGGKIKFQYEIRRESDDALVLKAESLQLFTTREGEFSPYAPDFYVKWQQEHNI